MYLKGTSMLMLQAEATTITVEFSHRGEVLQIFEFEKSEVNWSFEISENSVSESVFAS